MRNCERRKVGTAYKRRRRMVAPTTRDGGSTDPAIDSALSYRSSRGSMNKNDMLTSVVQPAETNSR